MRGAVRATLNEKDWERLRTQMPFPAPGGIPAISSITIQTSENVPEGKVVWLDRHGELLGIEDIHGA